MDSKLSLLKKVLEKPLESRDKIDLNLIASQIINVKFFDSLKDQKSIFQECCKYINYESVLKGQYVFKEGEIGDKFFILLQGLAGVIITIKEKDSVFHKEVLEYTDGSSFGELALKDNKPRAASILAKSDCHFAVLDKQNYNRILASILLKKQNELVELLRNQSFFKNLTRGSILKLSYCFEEKTVKKDQVLYKEGDTNNFLFLIREGELKLSQNVKIDMIDPNDPMTKGMIFLRKFVYRKADIGIVTTGELLGLSDLDNQIYTSTCICMSNTSKVLVITKKDFKRRINTQESLNLINTGVSLRNSIHQNSIKSMTKILKERVQSQYKKIFFEETIGKKFYEKKEETKPLLKANVNKDSTILDYSESTVENLSFDLSMSRVKKRRKRCYEEIRIIRPNYTRAEHSLEIKAEALDPRSQKVARIKKKNIIGHNSGSPELRSSFDTSPEAAAKPIPKQKTTMRSLISQFKPFGRYQSMNKPSKDTEVINIHTPRKEFSLHRPVTPRNWSFRPDMHSKRPVSSTQTKKN